MDFSFAINCKLVANGNIADICNFNSQLCQSLKMFHLAQIFLNLSSFLMDFQFLRNKDREEHKNNSANILDLNEKQVRILFDVGSNHYLMQFLKRMVVDLYCNQEIQALAFIACILRQSQYFVILFDCLLHELFADERNKIGYDLNADFRHVSHMKREIGNDNNGSNDLCGCILQSCVARYLEYFEIENAQINNTKNKRLNCENIRELQHFHCNLQCMADKFTELQCFKNYTK